MWSRLLAVLLASCCLLVFAAPANAERLTLRDPARDMWRAKPGGEVAPARWSETGDITRVRVLHRRHVVVVRLRFVNVRRAGIYAQYSVRVQGTGAPGHKRIREVVLEAGPRGWRGEARVFTGRGKLARRCDADHRIRYGKNRVWVRLERACLDTPRAVRVNVNAYRVNRDGAFFSDNPHDTSNHARAWSDWVKRTR